MAGFAALTAKHTLECVVGDDKGTAFQPCAVADNGPSGDGFDDFVLLWGHMTFHELSVRPDFLCPRELGDAGRDR
ncbi:hypothetical protein SPBR_05443 [Sporothrix brasiliensis 5110]|uniref:Uncharacterized protein n=1 Tax=Sporothrix brasiliensis 5110 TaxID=1398154 RepID=A0A0C2EM57_9PEZI|nr:uncharacterized protein SPBR_05443 [Sporothrix brasiliensis 5110]KIH87164.1 hypothetical protein SPBR_05443 [Sporothrix brasiliensis 5110]